MNTRKMNIIAAGLFASAILVPAVPAFAAAYMKYEGVDGRVAVRPSANTAQSKGWIELESYQFGTVGSRTCTGQGGAGVITAAAVRGATVPAPSATRIPKMTLQVDRPDGGYLQVELENVLITSATPAPAAGRTSLVPIGGAPIPAGQRPSENISLNFEKVSWSHTNCTAAMLLPAIQKVRDAANRAQ